MIIIHENNALEMKVPAPFKRTLKVLLSPAINPELKSLAVGLTILPPGGKSEEHKHIEGEMFYVVSGKGSIKVGEEIEDVTAGTAIWSSSGKSHQLMNNNNDTLKILWVLSPPGREAAILKQSG
ncbi:MAG: cupin domain-containing protein [bacterium]|nr:cupin domain-containing protein [bacterium]